MSRCQIVVHQKCHGAKDVQDFTPWVCKACETSYVLFAAIDLKMCLLKRCFEAY